VAVFAGDFEMLISHAGHLRDFQGLCLSVAPSSFTISSLSTWSFILVKEWHDPVCLNLYTVLWIVPLYSAVMSWNLHQNCLTFLAEPLFT
jgi:hypothetical protein